jgi:hypothetical protein
MGLATHKSSFALAETPCFQEWEQIVTMQDERKRYLFVKSMFDPANEPNNHETSGRIWVRGSGRDVIIVQEWTGFFWEINRTSGKFEFFDRKVTREEYWIDSTVWIRETDTKGGVEKVRSRPSGANTKRFVFAQTLSELSVVGSAILNAAVFRKAQMQLVGESDIQGYTCQQVEGSLNSVLAANSFCAFKFPDNCQQADGLFTPAYENTLPMGYARGTTEKLVLGAKGKIVSPDIFRKPDWAER